MLMAAPAKDDVVMEEAVPEPAKTKALETDEFWLDLGKWLEKRLDGAEEEPASFGGRRRRASNTARGEREREGDVRGKWEELKAQLVLPLNRLREEERWSFNGQGTRGALRPQGMARVLEVMGAGGGGEYRGNGGGVKRGI